MNPFDMPGPPFLVFYVFALIGAWILRFWLLQRFEPADKQLRPPSLSPYEVGYLMGDQRRAMETALAKLALDDALVATPSLAGHFTAVGDVPKSAPELVREVHRAMKTTAMTLPMLLDKVATPLGRINARLKDQQLLMTPGSGQALNWLLCSVGPLLAVGALGVSKIVVGVGRGRPIGILLLLVLATIVMMWIVRKPPRLTKLGREVEKAILRRNAALTTTSLSRSTDLSEADQLLAVALVGAGALAFGNLAWLHQAAIYRQPGRDGGGSDGGGGGSSDGGGGDGGGGGCGGGCGGCGGGCG